MKHLYVQVALAAAAAAMSHAVAAEPIDSTEVANLSEVVVQAVRAPKNAPFAVSKITRNELEQHARSAQELPFLFARTPGVMAWSENGLGTGTTYMRIRGAADSRINVTLDGVALNSPEDQCVFWANMNSYASLLGSVQIQRGVGVSSNGDGAFGGTISLSSRVPSLIPQLELSASYGSYNTYNVGGNFSTGLLLNHLVIDGAYHHTGTDGFVHGTDGNSGSYYAGLTYLNSERNVKISYKNIGNYERTGQAWNGVTAGDDNLSMMDGTYGADGFRNYADMYAAGYGRYNSLYERFVYDDDNYCFVTNPDGSYKTERYQMADGSLWQRTTDNFWQNHNLLNFSWNIDEHWSTSATLHYTHGHGYYDEFRYQNKLKKFGLANYTLADGTTLKRSDFVRQKGLTQDTYGLVWNAAWHNDRWDVQGGLALQNFQGNHYGYLTYVGNEELRQAVLADGTPYQYYDSDARKGDQSVFVRGTYHATSHLDIFADMQYRYVTFRTYGINDKFYSNGDGTYSNQQLNISRTYNFANPKVGLNYNNAGHNAYASYAMGNREPERNNFTDNGAYPAPEPERVHDLEAGYSYTGKCWHVGVGLYAMLYHNQFVQTGALSDIGENLTTNIAKSRRMGIEMSAGVEATKWLTLEANAALSQNRILDFDEQASVDWDDDFRTIHYDHSTLAFSPSAIVNGLATFHVGGFQATWHTGFVSKQFLDNTACDQRSLPSYTQTDIALSYDLQCWRKGLKHTIFGVNVNNLFNSHYARSGWVYSSIVESYGHPNENRYYQIGYIPSAGLTVMGSVTLKF